jgi:site-specific recombinase XerD
MVGAFLTWYGERWEYQVRLPKEIPQYVLDEDIDKLFQAIETKQTHKSSISRDHLLVELAIKSGLRRAELAELEVRDVHPDYLKVRQEEQKR